MTERRELSAIEKLPSELLDLSIFQYRCSDNELCKLSQTSKTMHKEFELRLQEKASKKLLIHVVRAEEELALNMIRANIRLLLYPSEAIDYSKRPYNHYTPFQAALLCHDVTLWKKMEPYFDRLPNGREEIARQFNALFPEGVTELRPYDYNTLTQAISYSSLVEIEAALQKTQNDTEICQALNQFRRDFTALSMREAFYNPSHLIKALQVYNEKFEYWGWRKRDLFWRQVIGYVQRFVPTCYAQAFVQVLYYRTEDKRPLERSLKYKYDTDLDTNTYFPLFDSQGLGFDFAICLGAPMPRGGPARDSWTQALVRCIDKLCSANTAELRKLERRVQHGDSITDNEPLISRLRCTIS